MYSIAIHDWLSPCIDFIQQKLTLMHRAFEPWWLAQMECRIGMHTVCCVTDTEASSTGIVHFVAHLQQLFYYIIKLDVDAF